MGVFIEEEEVLHIVLDGLSDEFYPFCTALRTRNEPVSLKELHVLITTEERSLKLKFESSNNLVCLAMIGTGPKPNPGNNSPMPPFNAQLNAQSHRGREADTTTSEAGEVEIIFTEEVHNPIFIHLNSPTMQHLITLSKGPCVRYVTRWVALLWIVITAWTLPFRVNIHPPNLLLWPFHPMPLPPTARYLIQLP